MADHVFDRAMALAPSGLGAGHFTGTTSPDYWNMVGPFGGTTAAVVLQSVMQHPDLLGTPIALTVNFAAAIEAGPYTVQATPVRTNRSTQHWSVQIAQADASGSLQVNTTASVVTARRRETWSQNDLPMPTVPPPDGFARLDYGASSVAWVRQFDMRPVSGMLPAQWDGGGEHSESVLWLRDLAPRAIDFPALASMSDMFFPRVWLRRARHVPAGTVSITTYFHAGPDELAEVGTGWLLGRAAAQQFRNGFFDQNAQVWSQAGALLATSQQIVYYKE